MDELKGKVAVVTGASSPRGIGNAIAKRFAQAGASLFLIAEGTAEQLETAVRECRAVGAGRIESAMIDLADRGAAERMIAQAEALLGRVDVLVNNAVNANAHVTRTVSFATMSSPWFSPRCGCALLLLGPLYGWIGFVMTYDSILLCPRAARLHRPLSHCRNISPHQTSIC